MEEEDFTKLSIEDRCAHKSWKARISGYEDVVKLFRNIDDEKSPEWNKYHGIIKKFVVDNNAPAQEKGLDAVLAFVGNCGTAGKTVNDVMSGLVQKCIAAPKAKTKDLAAQICLMYIEIEKHEVILDELLKGTESKNPKIAAACIHIITDALREFGPKVINPNKVVKRAIVLLEDRDKGVRDETKLLLIEVYRWLGPALKNQLASLKQTPQLTEMGEAFKQVSNTPAKPTRLLKSQQAKQAVVARAEDDGGDECDDGGSAEVEIDPYDLLEPVDVLAQLPKTFYTQLEAKAWVERKDALEGLEKSLNNAPKLENADYGELIRALKKIILKDSNIVVVCFAIRCVAGIAKGLKRKYHQYAVFTLQALFEKFKEKKPNVVVALRDASDHVFASTTLELILEDVILNLDNKNPSVKAEVAGFLARCFSKCTPAMLNKKLLIPLVKALLKSLADQDPTVRENAALALGTAMKVVGEKSMIQYLSDVDNQKMGKIKECYDKAVITAKPAKTTKVNKEPPKASSTSDKTVPIAKVVTPKMGATIVKKKASNSGGLALEEALKKAKVLLPEDIISKLDSGDSAVWADFLKAVQAAESDDLGEIVFAITCGLPAQDNSSKLLSTKLSVMKLVVSSASISKTAVENAIPIVSSGLAQKDCSEMANELMSAFSSLLSVNQVARAALTNETVLSNPSSYAAALNWITSAIMKHGGAVDHAFLEECGKNALSQCDQVRNAGLALIGIMHLPVHGSSSSGDAGPSKPEKPVKSSSTSKVNDTLKVSERAVDENIEKEAKPSNEPRVDIGNQISNEQILGEFADKNWKVRAEAVAKAQGIVNSAQSITGNLGDVPPLIAARITDSNTKIAASTIGLVESLAKAMGPAGKQHVKVFLPPLLKSIGDPKTWIRTPAIACVNSMGEACGYREFFENEMIADALKSGSPTTRAELWTWLSEKLPNIPVKTVPKDELNACLPVLYNNLEDRNAEVRKAANDAVLGFMIHLGFNAMSTACENIVKGSNMATIKAILDKTRGLLPEKPITKSKTQPSMEKGSARSATAKMAPGSSATITKSAKPKPGSAPAARAGARKKEEDADTGSMLKVNSLKNQRSIDDQKLKTIKWNFTSPRAEYVEFLRDQMTTAGFNKNLIANMFHADFKYHLKAIDSLVEELPINLPGLVSNLDLVLRWMTLRFFDTNPSVIVRGLDYLSSAFGALRNENYAMLEFEASAFIPYLTLKIGDPKDVVQTKVKDMFELLKLIYPVGKLFMYVMDGTKSKNSRQRAACLDVLNSYLECYGGSVCQPSLNAVVKDIVKHFADRDATVRQSVFRVAVSLYSHEGERFFQVFNQFAEKDGQLLEDRIRKSAKNRPVASVKPMSIEAIEPEEVVESGDEYPEDVEEAPTYHPSTSVNSPPPQSNATVNVTPPSMTYRQMSAASPRNRNVQAMSYQTSASSQVSTFVFDERILEDLESEPPVLALNPPKVADIDINFLAEGSVQAAIKPIQMPRMTPTLSNFTQPTAIKYEITQISSSDIEKAMASMSQIDTVLNSDKKNTLLPFVNFLISQLVTQLTILNQSYHPEVVNCYRANFALLTKICSNQVLCAAIDEQWLYKVLDQVLSLLAESKQETVDRQEMFRRVLNNIVLKLLENADKTAVICALITMLGETMGKPSTVGHYHDLCIRCLWKLIRAQSKWDKELNYNRLLFEYQKFLKDYPSAWWRSQEVDVPLRTVKTMLHTMVKLRGIEVRDIINTDTELATDSELSLYVKKLVKHLKIEENKDLNKSHGETADRLRVSKPPVPSASPRLIIEHANELSEIFKLIGEPNETNEGLKKLYAFKNAHPEADIQPFLVKASSVFQDYIKRGLQELEAQNNQNANHQLHSNSFSFSCRADEEMNESCAPSEKPYTSEVERFRNRLSQLQEKAGCNETKRSERVEVPRDNKHVEVEKTQRNDDVELIRERLERCKSRAFKS